MTSPSDLPPLPPRRPASVDRALTMLWIGVALGAVSVFAVFTMTRTPSLAALIVTVVGVAITAFLIGKIAAGNNGARIVLLILFGIGTFRFLLDVGTQLVAAPLLALLDLLYLVLQAGALYLVFTGRGADWFKPT